MIFGGDLSNVMYDIYVLAHFYGISPIYVESIPPVDRDVLMFFVQKEQQELEEENKNNSTLIE